MGYDEKRRLFEKFVYDLEELDISIGEFCEVIDYVACEMLKYRSDLLDSTTDA